MEPYVVDSSYQTPLFINNRCRGMSNKILVGTVARSKAGDLDDEVREVFYRWPKKELNVVVQGVFVKRRLLVRFQNFYDKDPNLNKLIIMSAERRPVTKEAKVPTISVITDYNIDLEKGYYHTVYIFIHFEK